MLVRSCVLAAGRSVRIPLALSLLTLLAGCQKKNTLQLPPPPTVTVAKPVSEDVVETMEFTGQTKARESVELRSRVTGYLEKINFQDGAWVNQGDLLFVIEQAPFQAELDAAEASLAKAQAALQLAEANVARTMKLAQEKASTQQQIDVQKAELETAKSEVRAAEVTVTQAKLNLAYTEIRAPISGQIGRHLVDIGNLIQSGEDPLAVVQSTDPIHAYFYVSESDVLRFMSLIRSNELPDPSKVPPKLKMGLGTESTFPHEGTLDFRDPAVDPATGTILRRGTFPNPDRTLIPGLFVKIRAEIGAPKPKLLVEERAISSDQRGDYLLIVKEKMDEKENRVKKVVEYRPVKLGIAVGKKRVIEDGLSADDLVIVNGLQRARPNSEVTPELQTPEAALAAAAADAN